MTVSRRYPQLDVKVLYGLAGGRCAFSNCRREIILESMSGEEIRQIGKIAHIIAHSNEGPRGDPSHPRNTLDGYGNWILLCPTCHDTVDALDSNYTVADLRKLKSDHEQWVRSSLANEMPGVGFPELEVVTKGIAGLASDPSDDFTVTPPQQKMARNSLTKQVHLLLTMGLSKSKEVHRYVQHVAMLDSDFPERLKAGFLTEYSRLSSAGIGGDALFEAMREFSSGRSREFTRQAAGLAVLSYLFERCELFEK